MVRIAAPRFTGNSAGSDARRVRRHVAVSAAITALGGLLFGYDTGVVSGALLFVKHNFGGLSSFQQELVTSLLLVGAVAGALGAGRVSDWIGRRPTVLVTALVFIVGVLLAAFTPTYPTLLVARVIIGLAVGSASMVVPLYIGEIVPPRVRGGLVSLNQLAITAGILGSYLIDYGLSGSGDWRLMFGLAVIPAAALFAGMLFQRESPHWLIRQGREDEAREVLRRVRNSGSAGRGSAGRGIDDHATAGHSTDGHSTDGHATGNSRSGNYEAAGEDDIDEEIRAVREIARRQSGVRELVSPRLRPLVLVGIMLAVFQQVTGINTVIYYAPSLLQDAGFGNSGALLANVVNGAINVGMTIVAIWLLDKVGRRPLLLCGTAGMAVGMIVTALSFLGGAHLTGGLAIVAIVGLFFYTGSFAIGLGPVFWLLIAEIYPLKIRGAAMSIASMANWAANFVVTISFLTLLSTIGGDGVFFLFGFLTVVALIYFWRRVPETKGRSLPEIERDLVPVRP